MSTPLYYPPTTNGLQKTLDASLLTGVTASATLNNVTGIQNLKGIMVIDRVDGNNNLTPNKREYISFAGTSGSTVVTLTRGLAGSTDQDHAVGAVVEFVSDVVQQQAIIDGLLQVITTAGVLDTSKVQTPLSKATATENVAGTDDAKYLTALSNVPAFNNSMYRQTIINGNFDIWQRGTSLVSGGSSPYVIADRWQSFRSGNVVGATFSQQDGTGVTGSKYCLRAQRNNGISTTNALSIWSCSMESINAVKFRSSKVTMSFWARCGANYSPASSLLVASIRSGTGSDEATVATWTGQNTDATTSVTLTTSWQKFTLTTSSVLGASINNLGVTFDATPTGTAGTNDWFDIAQVQLCAGNVALPFMPKSFEEELRACQRYYEKSYLYSVAPLTSTTVGIHVSPVTDNTVLISQRYASVYFKVNKRTNSTPTIYPFTTPTNTGRVSAADTGGDLGASSGTVAGASDSSFNVYNATGGTLSTNGGAIMFHWAVDAEL